MSRRSPKTASVLSVVVIALTAAATLAGLISPGLYQDPAAAAGFSKAYWLGNNIVGLAVAVPLLAGALFFARRGSLRARLVWLGMAYFTTYSYSFYLFGGNLNWFYPLHAALVTLPVFVLIAGLAGTDVAGLSWGPRVDKAFRWIAGYMLIVAAVVTATWVAQWPGALTTEPLDPRNADFIRTVGGLDIWLLVGSMVLGAVLLWRRRPWGYVAAAIANVGVGLYMLVLTVVSFTAADAGVEGALGELPVWIIVLLGCLACSVTLLRGLPRRSTAPHPARAAFVPE